MEGVKILIEFFKKEIIKFKILDLYFFGRKIIECCLDDGSLDDYVFLIK